MARWRIGSYVNHTENHAGQLTDQAVQVNTGISGPRQLAGDVYLVRRKEYFDGILYEHLDGVDLYASLRPTGALRLGFHLGSNDVIDYANNQPADERLLNFQVEAKIGRHINANLDHTSQRLDVEGGRLFDADLTRADLSGATWIDGKRICAEGSIGRCL